MNPWHPHTVTKTILCSSVPYGRSILTVIDLSFAIVFYFLKISIAVVCVLLYFVSFRVKNLARERVSNEGEREDT